MHHIEYLSNHKIWEYDDKHLITLCEDCHSYVHELKALTNNKALNIISKGVPYSDVLSFIETISELTAVSYKIKKERDIEKE